MRRLLLAVAGLVAAGVFAGTAGAHVQVTPTLVAPRDPVLFTVLVPNESDSPTVSVELRIPDGVVPFAFEPVPGWKRTETRAANQALERVVWRGSLPAGSFVRFSFLASTPPQPGSIVWRALQTYRDGTVVRWIGDPGSEEPAAITVVSAGAPRQNAGGESSAAPAPSPAPPAASTAVETVPADTGTQAEPRPVETEAAAPATIPLAAPAADSPGAAGDDGLALVAVALAVAALAAAIIALALARRRAADGEERPDA
jgi:uncharacterized protein YcnI